eukprot:327707_1
MAIWGGFLSVVATLRVHFAQAVTLGCSIGDMFQKHFQKSIEPMVTELLPAELKKWAPKFSSTAARSSVFSSPGSSAVLSPVSTLPCAVPTWPSPPVSSLARSTTP